MDEQLQEYEALDTRQQKADWLIERMCVHEGRDFSAYLYEALSSYSAKYDPPFTLSNFALTIGGR